MVQRLPSRRRTRQIGIAFVVLLILVVISISTVIRLYTNLLWYRSLHFTVVFWTILRSELLLGVGLGMVFFLFCLANLFIVARLTPVFHLAVDPNDPFTRYRTAVMPYMSWIAAGISAFLALLFGISAAPLWSRLELALHAVPFHQVDPVFHRDISFYVFRLPFYQYLYGWAFAVLIVVTLLVAVAHYAQGGIRPQAAAERVTPQVKAHLSVLIGLIALLKAWGYRLGEYNLLYSTRGKVTGASYTDIHAELPALRLLVVISIIGAILFLVNIRFRGWALPIVGAGLWLLTSVAVAGIYPFIIQRFVVVPSQLQKETPYIQRNITATRTAYGINITPQPYQDQGDITSQVVNNQASVLNSVRLWDPGTLETAYSTLQEIRPYYSFEAVNPDRYQINGQLQEVMISTRELNTSGLPGQNWQNQHLIYTHGYGADVSPANAKTPEGQPDFYLENIPPTSTVASMQLTQPEIYFGEGQLSNYTLVDSKQQELDYSSPSQDVYSSYSGSGGVPISGFFNRLVYAWEFKDINILISGLIGPHTKIVYFSQIQARLQMAAPFINWDTNPYPVIDNGRILWMADGYTVSDMYPYSQQEDLTDRTTRTTTTALGTFASIPGQENYIRDSVKATIDAYNGTVKMYIWDPTDPVINTWAKAFPGLFLPAKDMPSGLVAHVRYPEDLFSVQTYLYQTYHVTNPRTFFTNGDTWQIPPDPNQPTVTVPSSHGQEIQPYYVLETLPGQTQPRFDLILPMNPSGKQNMAALITAQSSPVPGGQTISTLAFPPGSLVQGVGQVSARIQATGPVSTAHTLLGQQGSTVTFGNLLVVPVGNSLLYVEPMFVASESNAVPLLENVIAATASAVGFAPDLQSAITQLVNGTASTSTGPPTSGGSTPTPNSGPTSAPTPTSTALPGSEQALAQQAQTLFKAWQSAEGSGNFTAAAQYLNQLSQLLQSIASPSPAASASPPATKSP
jgi:uncharacterized membrane protein (UPF0182 family)